MTRGCVRKCPFGAPLAIERFHVENIPLRKQIEIDGTAKRGNLLGSLSSAQKTDFLRLVRENRLNGDAVSDYREVNELLAHYKKGKSQIPEEGVQFQ
jgi:hypothetical protein